MDRAQIASLRRSLLRWYHRAARDLPWRRTSDPYAIWISEVMLQQTQVATVIPYYQRFLTRFPTVHELARAELPEVLADWSGLGYYSRARNLHRAARVIAGDYGGALPREASELRRLPGFGPYTAGAVASIAFDRQVAAVDGNVVRVLSRVGAIEGDPSTGRVRARIAELAGELAIGPQPGKLNQALMELGATLCSVREPGCEACPGRRFCRALALKRVGDFPSPKPRAERKALRLSAAVILDRGRVLLARRPDRGLFGGLWELPNAEGGARELERLIGVKPGRPLAVVERTLTHRDLAIRLRVARPAIPDAQAWGYQELRWASLPGPRAGGPAGALGMATAWTRCLEIIASLLRDPRMGRHFEP